MPHLNKVDDHVLVNATAQAWREGVVELDAILVDVRVHALLLRFWDEAGAANARGRSEVVELGRADETCRSGREVLGRPVDRRLHQNGLADGDRHGVGSRRSESCMASEAPGRPIARNDDERND